MSGSYYEDSSNRGNVNELLDEAELYRDQALQYSNEAEASATAASNSEANAATSEAAAIDASTNALASASSAASSATTASTNAANAISAANSASTSASNAALSEANAADSAANAATTLSNALVKTNNLSDLSNVSTARTNLGLVPQTSTTDTTAGALLTVGAFGLGGPLVSSSDLNAITRAGLYVTATATTPGRPADGFWAVLHMGSNASNGCQYAQIIGGSGVLLTYVRSQTSGVWGSWQQIITGVKQTTSTDTTAGALLEVGSFGLGNTTSPRVTNLDTLTATGFYSTDIAATGAPDAVSSFDVLHQNRVAGGTAATQIAISLQTNQLYIRTRVPPSAWGSWKPLVTGVKQTSSTDTTAGAVLTVGAFGLGAQAPFVTDANSIPLTSAGIYALNTPFTNGPTATFHTILHSVHGGSPNQLAITAGTGTPLVYVRGWTGSAWGSWSQLLTASSALGIGQTWQSVTRTENTTYTNSTGKPIVLMVTYTASTPGQRPSFTVGGVSGLLSDGGVGTSGNFAGGSIIIPTGATYSWANAGGGSATSVVAQELR